MFIKARRRIDQYLKFLDKAKYRRVRGLEWAEYATAERLRTPPESVEWTPITLPHAYGEEWMSFWFRGSAGVPEAAAGEELFLAASPNTDTLVFLNGEPIGALNPYHGKIRLAEAAKGGERLTIHLESYGGHRFPGMGPMEDEAVFLTIGAAIPDYPNRFRGAELVVKARDVYDLYYDAQVLFDTARNLDDNSLRGHRIIHALHAALSLIHFTASGDELEQQAKAARRAIAPLLAASPGDTVPRIHLIGHAHIDHAWIWPIWETERKAARTFANMVRLAEEFEEFIFVQSQPAQLEIVEREYPAVFDAVKRAYERGQWEPNGGMWIEADCNIPNGESLIRQFIIGKQASKRMLNYEGDTLWLPDVFGYAAALPQILAGCEIEYFVTSKINWNDTTRFPHDTFLWRGIDGTGVKTHFITARRHGYNGRVTVDELHDSWNNLQHKELHGQLVKPVGEGDGGGGTMRADLESARRLGSLEGAPRVRWTRVSESLGEIFGEIEALPEWHGELYLELHRGTYTTQARTKRWNRVLEFRLREVEALYTMLGAWAAGAAGAGGSAADGGAIGAAAVNAAAAGGVAGAAAGGPPSTLCPAYPREALTRCWKKLLTNQFHDIIPGSSIRAVYEDAERWYEEVNDETNALIAAVAPGFAALAGFGGGGGLPGVGSAGAGAEGGTGGGLSGAEPAEGGLAAGPAAYAAVNTFSWDRSTLLGIPIAEGETTPTGARIDGRAARIQVSSDVEGRRTARLAARLPSMSVKALELQRGGTEGAAPGGHSFIIKDNEMQTPFYRTVFDDAGRIRSLIDRESGTEFVQSGCAFNDFVSAEDVPIFWEAWDIDADWELKRAEENRLAAEAPAPAAEVVSAGELFVQLRRRYAIGKRSKLTQDVYFYADSRRIDFDTKVEWHEERRLLKTAFPANVTTDRVRCEVQYGHLWRNTHENRPEDQAQFEFAAQKWIAVEEHGRGLALLTDCKYGYDVKGSAMRLTLLRSPKAPDPQADMGDHRFTYAILPFEGAFSVESVVREAYDLNHPATVLPFNTGVDRGVDPGAGSRSSGPRGSGTSLLRLDTAQVIIEALKIPEGAPGDEGNTGGAGNSGSADEAGGDMILRLYEAGGGTVNCTLSAAYPLESVHETNMLERNPRPLPLEETRGSVKLHFRPFEIKTLRLKLQPAGDERPAVSD